MVRKVRHNKEETIEGRKCITFSERCTGQYNRAMLRCAFRVWGRPILPHISTHGHATPPPPSTGRCSHNQHNTAGNPKRKLPACAYLKPHLAQLRMRADRALETKRAHISLPPKGVGSSGVRRRRTSRLLTKCPPKTTLTMSAHRKLTVLVTRRPCRQELMEDEKTRGWRRGVGVG